MTLLDREQELAGVRRLLSEAQAGQGGALLIEGVAGIGKTSLLRVAAEEARADGFLVLAARGAQLERDFPYGLVEQLLGPVVRAADQAARAELFEGAAGHAVPVLGLAPVMPAPDPASARAAAFHGLFWLLANLTERTPILLAVDDAHWADGLSLEFLGFLARRAADLPAAVMLAARPAEPHADAALAAWRSDPVAKVLVLPPLGPAAVGRLVEETLETETDAAFAQACAAQTRGNPLLLHELLLAMRREHVQPTAASAERIGKLGGEAIAPMVRQRLERLPAAARALAEALSVLGPGAELRHAADLAGLALADAAGAVDALVAADLADPGPPPAFRHPLVEAAVQAGIAPGRRGLLHARTATLLAAEGAEPGRVATQLLASPPAGVPEAASTLRAAAADAMSKGAPAAAIAFLMRALAEPPQASERAKILRELGIAESADRRREAFEHLAAARAAFDDPSERAATALELGRALLDVDRSAEACAVLAGAADEARATDRELWLRLEAELKLASRMDLTADPALAPRFARVAAGLSGATPAERLVLAVRLATEPPGRARSAAEAAALAQDALAEALPRIALPPSPMGANVVTLIAADRLDEAERAAGRIIDDARARGLSSAYGMGLSWRSWAAQCRGALEEAEADIRAALDLIPSGSAPLPAAVAGLVRVLIDRGELTAAQEALAANDYDGALPRQMIFNGLLFERGRLRAGQRRFGEAIEDLAELGGRYERLGIRRPFPPWREELALAYSAADEPAEAHRWAQQELEVAAEWGTPRGIGTAQRTLALVAPGGPDVELLAASVATLDPSPARLELARSLIALGAVLRRRGERAAAREPLGRGMSLAARCGATALAQTAREELRATGARPRRLMLSGPDALTATERRIAQMAATGLTNKQIAQDLFVTTRTVETHLRHSYQKLDISSRAQLAEALRENGSVGDSTAVVR